MPFTSSSLARYATVDSFTPVQISLSIFLKGDLKGLSCGFLEFKRSKYQFTQ